MRNEISSNSPEPTIRMSEARELSAAGAPLSADEQANGARDVKNSRARQGAKRAEIKIIRMLRRLDVLTQEYEAQLRKQTHS
jgi:hypothetical protein